MNVKVPDTDANYQLCTCYKGDFLTSGPLQAFSFSIGSPEAKKAI